MHRRVVIALLLAVPMLLHAALVLRAARDGYPVLDGDARIFVPPMIVWSTDGKLVNPVWGVQIDPAGLSRYVYHMPFYPMLVGSLLREPTYAATGMVLAGITVLQQLFFVVLLIALASKIDARCAALVLLLYAVNSIFATGNPGRPEPLVTLFLLTGALACLATPSRQHGRIAGVSLGLVLAVHPIAFALAWPLFGVACAWRAPAPAALRTWLATGGLAVCVCALTFMPYPYPLEDWFAGMLNMSNSAFVTHRGLGPVADMVEPFRARASAVLAVPAVALALWLLRPRVESNPPATPALACVFAGLFATCAFVFGFITPARGYYLKAFSPLVFAVVFMALQSRPPKFVAALILVSLLATSANFARQSALAVDFLRHGMTRAEAQERLAGIRAQVPGPIGLSPGLFSITERYDQTLVRHVHRLTNEADTILLQQVNRSELEPPPLDGFRCTENHFIPEPPRLFGIPLARTAPGYNFAVYRREERR